MELCPSKLLDGNGICLALPRPRSVLIATCEGGEMRKVLFLALALLVGLAPVVHAQFAAGNVYGTVTDESGAVLPGAAVTIAGDLGSRSTTTGGNGEFRFLNLDN